MLGENSVMQQFCPSWTDSGTVVLLLNKQKNVKMSWGRKICGDNVGSGRFFLFSKDIYIFFSMRVVAVAPCPMRGSKPRCEGLDTRVLAFVKHYFKVFQHVSLDA